MAIVGTNPIDMPELYDALFVGGLLCPGVPKVDKAKRSLKWDSKTGKGQSGATSTFQGNEISVFTVELKLWLPQHFNQDTGNPTGVASWDELRELLLQSNKANKITALDVQHPYLQELNIFSVVLDGLPQLSNPKDGDTLRIATFDLREYNPPKASGGTPGGSKSKGGTGGGSSGAGGNSDKPTAKDAREEEIARLLAEAKSV